METFTPEVLASMPGISSILDGLQAYTLRHFSRISRIIQSTFLVDYTLSNMNVLIPENGPGMKSLDASEGLQSMVGTFHEKTQGPRGKISSSDAHSASSSGESGGDEHLVGLNLSVTRSITSSDLEEVSSDGEITALHTNSKSESDTALSSHKRKRALLSC